MGAESPDFCRELGAAIGAIMFNRRTLLVASADILSASEESLAIFKDAVEQGDVNALYPLLYSNEVDILGKGALLVALIATLRRRAKRFRILSMSSPENGTPGHVGVVISR